jgi:hypothetical protein
MTHLLPPHHADAIAGRSATRRAVSRVWSWAAVGGGSICEAGAGARCAIDVEVTIFLPNGDSARVFSEL